MKICEGIGYDYIIKHYMDDRQLNYYTERVFEKGLSEVEKYLLRSYCLTTDKILDIGTGCGRFAINAYQEGYGVMYGIDINPVFIKRAQQIVTFQKYNIKFFVQNAQSTTFNDEIFDAVFFTSDGFSQIPGNKNKLAVLKEIYRILKHNNICIIAVIDEVLARKNQPDYAGIIDYSRKNEDWKKQNFYDDNDVYIYDGGYMHFASIHETKELIKKAGFKILNNLTS